MEPLVCAGQGHQGVFISRVVLVRPIHWAELFSYGLCPSEFWSAQWDKHWLQSIQSALSSAPLSCTASTPNKYGAYSQLCTVYTREKFDGWTKWNTSEAKTTFWPLSTGESSCARPASVVIVGLPLRHTQQAKAWKDPPNLAFGFITGEKKFEWENMSTSSKLWNVSMYSQFTRISATKKSWRFNAIV